jgi:hypothetical protein
VIARAGKPMVKVPPIEEEPKAKPQRLGFMIGQLNVPDDFFDPALDKEIEQLFYGEIE